MSDRINDKTPDSNEEKRKAVQNDASQKMSREAQDHMKATHQRQQPPAKTAAQQQRELDAGQKQDIYKSNVPTETRTQAQQRQLDEGLKKDIYKQDQAAQVQNPKGPEVNQPRPVQQATRGPQVQDAKGPQVQNPQGPQVPDRNALKDQHAQAKAEQAKQPDSTTQQNQERRPPANQQQQGHNRGR